MSDKKPAPAGERLAKVIARAGVCSRRDAESWITAGRVAVNGAIVKTPAFNVIDSDKIVVDGRPVAQKEATQLWLYHKPAGLMVTEKDPEGRPTVFEAVESLGLPRVLSVGRLDFNTEGLLLLTNDGGVKRTLELPVTGWVRRYRVRAFGKVTQAQLDTLADGITVEGVDYGPIEATLDSEKASNVWITMSLREGKNREVRNVLGALGLEVNRLIRLSYGPFQLGDLPVGAVEQVKSRVLQDQLGKRLAEASGADFAGAPEGDPSQPRRRMPEKPESRPTERDRFGGLRKRPDFKRPERPETPARTVHFSDGRPPESFVPRGDPDAKRGDFKRDGKPGARDGGFKKRFDDDGPRKPRRDGDKPYSDRPPRRDGDKPFAKSAHRDAGKSFGDRPPRRDGDKPFAKGPRRDAGKPFGDRPPRRDGDKPFAKGPRSDKPAGAGRTFSKGPRPDRPARDGDRPARSGGDRPFSKGPRREGAGGRPEGARPPRRDGEQAAMPQDGRRFNGPRAGKPAGRADGGKSFGTPGGRPQGRPGAKPGGRPTGGRPADSRPTGARPTGGRPGGARPTGGRPTGGRPAGGGGRPGGAGPRKPRGQ